MKTTPKISPLSVIPEEVRALIRADTKWMWSLFAMSWVVAFLELLSLVTILFLASAVLGQELPKILGSGIVNPYLDGYTPKDLLIILGGAFMAISFLRLVFFLAYFMLGNIWSTRVTRNLHARTMEGIISADLQLFDKEHLGRMTYGLIDVPLGARWAVDGVATLILVAALMITIVAAMVIVSPWSLLIGAVIFIGLGGTLLRTLQTKVRHQQAVINEGQSSATEIGTEVISGIRDIKAIGAEQRWVNTFSKEIDKMQGGWKNTRILQIIPPPTLQAFIQIIFAGMAVIAGVFMSSETIASTLPAIGAVIYGLFRLYPAFSQGAKAWMNMGRAVPLLQIAKEWTDLPEDQLAGGTQEAPKKNGVIYFQDVAFGYNGTGRAVSDLDFRIEPGKVTGLAGESGAGKSTLIDLLLKFRAPERGAIWLGTQNLQDIVRQSWLRNVGVVRQDVFLFAGTLRENFLAWKPDSTEDQMLSACRQAGALDFIERLPDGLNTVVGDRGLTLSGGQRQRIAIARVLLRNPQVLILDEALSALDGETEEEVLRSLLEQYPDRTIILVSHRLTTIQRSDHIIVLDRGRVAGQGTHAELIGRNSRYKELFRTQVGQEPSTLAGVNTGDVG